ncbi:MAG: hypothetical protein A2162_08940 [Deltaproteobacteria bacterium RBG_13_52_11b]|nr:MAG: hypothetical protein A2162_08940 [Deltaproteobacteria bacterium RBG_13_52_11b]
MVLFLMLLAVFQFAGPLQDISQAQEYPSKEIKLIVPISPGGGVDLVARILADNVEKILGVSIVVVNNAAGAGAVGALTVAQAKPDGYTLLNGYTGLIIMKPLLTPDVPYRPSDYTPVCQTVGMPVAIFVQNEAPWKTLKELADYAKKNPGKLRAAVGPAGGFLQVLTDLFKAEAKVNFADIPSKGGVTQSAALMGGHADLCTDAIAASINFVKAGKLRILASTHKLSDLPAVKTFDEAGYPEVSLKLWHAILAPKGLPKPILTKLTQAYEKACQDRSVQEKLEKLNVLVDYRNSEETAKFIESEYKKSAKVLKDTGMTK